jgi:hypothetical protein
MMTATTQVLIPALREARQAEAAVTERLTAHAALTPAGQDRTSLEDSIGDARDHLRRLDDHLNMLQPPGPAQILGGVWHLTRQAAWLPFHTAMAIPAALLRGKTATEQQQLKNTEEQYAVTAYAVATCRAGEHIARTAGDTSSSDLLGTIRRADEDQLQELEHTLQRHAEAVVDAATAPPKP